MYVYGKDQRIYYGKRTKIETLIMHLLTINVGVQVGCLAFSLYRVATAASESMESSFFALSKIKLSQAYYGSCESRTVVQKLPFRNVSVNVLPENVEYFVSRYVTQMRYLFFLASLLCLLTIVNSWCLWAKVGKLQVRFVLARRDMLPVWILATTLCGIFQVDHVVEENDRIASYLRSCGMLGKLKVHRIMPYYEMIISFGFTLGLFVLNLLVALCARCLKNPKKKFLRQEATERRQAIELQTQNTSPTSAFLMTQHRLHGYSPSGTFGYPPSNVVPNEGVVPWPQHHVYQDQAECLPQTNYVTSPGDLQAPHEQPEPLFNSEIPQPPARAMTQPFPLHVDPAATVVWSQQDEVTPADHRVQQFSLPEGR
ncbi:hypothetical protein ERJ75_000461000 [Trypanosoma vivax]|uniref:Uncharacterized protein n=1 Tax=Trypanosoma vivax (strain Y486) TaxID=1055687 RepID=G0U547_TRYVY|nr:hypothetical protein ERJ75_000461000 [Trypanosoma vivax]CCC50995.1 conserved hypothetical protein [Trypanosoma vivax Y486]